jgi:type IV pilus assembly protein PilC
MNLTARPKMKLSEKIVITKHLSTMLKAGIPLEEAFLTLLEQNKKSANLQKILKSILENIQNGQSLEKSIQPFEYTFGPLYKNLIKISEESGTLEENLEYLAVHLEKEQEIKKKVQAALLYPGIVLFSTFGMGGAISFFVLPKLIELFESLNFELPLTTKILLWFAMLVRDQGIWLFLGTILFFFSFGFLFAKSKKFKQLIQNFSTKIPAIGPLILYAQLEQFCRNLGMLIKNGVPVDDSLDTTAKTLTHFSFQETTQGISEKMKSGKKISEIMINQDYKEFPILVSRMIAIGEKTGNLDKTLLYLADYYAQEIDGQTKNVTTLLEPILLLIVGLTVGFIAIAVISPIYGITSQLR